MNGDFLGVLEMRNRYRGGSRICPQGVILIVVKERRTK
jgi:hypothetical protein